MDANERNLQHAMLSFALWGGILINPRRPGASEPVVSRRSSFVPVKINPRP